MMNNLLKAHLEPFVRRQRRRQRRWQLAVCWTVAACLGLGVVALQRSGSATLSLALPLLAVLGVTAAIVIGTRRRQEPDWHAIARRIEAEYPELNGLLLTAVQQEGKDGELNYLQDRLVREATMHNLRNDWTNVIPRSGLALAQTANLLALAFFVIVLWQLRVPLSHTRLAQKPSPGVTVTPGDTSIERGNTLVVLARFGDALPANVNMIMGSSSETNRRIPLVKSLADPVFGGSVPEVTSNFTYHVEYGSKRTPDFKVTVFEYPRLERADADLTFPEYTGQEPKRIENTRRISAVEGSRLDFTLQLNKPVVSARLVARNEPRTVIPLLVESNRPVATLQSMLLESSRNYDLQLVDTEGRSNKVSSQFIFAVLTNRSPELKIASPRGDTRPSALEEIVFEGTVWDDFGVRNYGLAYTTVGEETKFISLGQIVPAKEKKTFQHLLRLEDLAAQPDQVIAWYVWAEDVGPDGEVRRTAGDMFFAEVRPFEEIFREGQGGGDGQQDQQQQSGGQQGGQQQAGSVADLQKQIINATWRLQRDHGAKKTPAAAPAVKPPGAKPVQQRSAAPANREMLSHRPVLAQFAGQRGRGQRGAQETQPGSNRNPRNVVPASSSGSYVDDATVVRDSEAEALEQARTAMERQQDPRMIVLWEAAIKRMEQALEKLEAAKDSPAALPQALLEQQAAYQALLKLQEREYQVNRSRQRGQQQGGNSSREQQMRQQLDQMDLTQTENRYQTQSQAQRPQSAERQEQLQVMNRLQELARRQQDLNDRLRELQAALQEARTEQEREEARRQLKRLQEEQQQMLADVDELRQRMDRPENQSEMAEERQQLEQTRQDVQRAAEAAQQGSPAQALASGTRAQRQLQELRDQMRRENSSEFAEDLREMRAQARELAQQQEELVRRMEQEAAREHRTLSDPSQREMLDQLARQREGMTNLIERATQVSQDAESSEPLLSRQLYDSVRKFSQDTARDVKELRQKLVDSGLLTRNLDEQLERPSDPDSSKLVDITSEMLRMDFMPPAQEASRRARADLNDLARGVERAAENVLGDDAEALRLAQQQLDRLTDALQREMAGAQGGGTNAQARGPGSRRGAQGTNDVQMAQAGERRGGAGSNRDAQANNEDQNADQTSAGNGQQQSGQQQANQQGQGQRSGQQQPGNQEGQGQRSGQQQAGNQEGQGQQPGQQAANQEGQGQQPGQRGGQRGGQQNGDQQSAQAEGNGQQTGQNGNADQPGGQRGSDQQQLAQDAQSPGQNQNRGGNRGQRGGTRQGGGRLDAGNQIDGGYSLLDQLLDGDDNDLELTGPITGEDFVRWSDGLRNVEEMIEIPALRNSVAVARERARLLRQDYRREGKKPDWAVVRLQVMGPLVEVRERIADELARRASQEALVPLDRDPVPSRYSDLVRRYYEELGKDNK